MSKAINNGDSHSEILMMSGTGVGELAPRSDWNGMREHEHFVQFYETDTYLLDSLGSFIAHGLENGDAGIVIATQEHRDGLEARLKAGGLDVASLIENGQLVSLDARETLSKILVGGAIDLPLFHEIIGGIITRAAEGRPRVRIFGEMVALLWAEGNYGTALSLEALWNDLQKTQRFSLFCGYPISGFCGNNLAEPLQHVCTSHSSVIPAESYSTLTGPDERLRAIILLQQKAKLLEAEIAERKEVENALRSVQAELKLQLEERESLLLREQIARSEAEAANRLKDEFLATVSHELRTPLTAILGWSHLLRQGNLEKGAIGRALETIERNAKVQAQLVEDILDVSRVITGKLQLNVGPVDAASVINAAIDSVQLAAESKGIQIEVTLDPSVRRLSGDASRLQQVVWNLLSNAIKFTPSGGDVRVRLERAGEFAQIRVSDTGTGIPQDFLPFIFDRFRQGDGTTTRRHGGLGLGLAIVRHLVELHGGTVDAESHGEGEGTTFIIRLPLSSGGPDEGFGLNSLDAVSQRLKEESREWLKPLPTLEGVRVLLVDDDPDILTLLTLVLSECKATVQAAVSVSEALEMLEWYSPQVLVSDLAMPDEDGYALIQRIRAREAEGSMKPIQAVALTSYARVEDRLRALSAGFNMFVPKPVEPRELIIAISNLVIPEDSIG